MNIIETTLNQNLLQLSNWVDSTPTSQIIDTMTYDLYESDNPFRKITSDNINNKTLRYTAKAVTDVGAEMFSVFANPYYLTHKIITLPTMYKSVAETYKKYSDLHNQQNNTL